MNNLIWLLPCITILAWNIIDTHSKVVDTEQELKRIETITRMRKLNELAFGYDEMMRKEKKDDTTSQLFG